MIPDLSGDLVLMSFIRISVSSSCNEAFWKTVSDTVQVVYVILLISIYTCTCLNGVWMVFVFWISNKYKINQKTIWLNPSWLYFMCCLCSCNWMLSFEMCMLTLIPLKSISLLWLKQSWYIILSLLLVILWATWQTWFLYFFVRM